MNYEVEWCPYAVLCQVPASAKASAPAQLQSASELLLAIANRQLHVFARRSDRVASSCACDAGGLRQNGFNCPHIKSYDDYAHVLTIPTNSVSQVYMTYRTATTTANTKNVATRTKDLVLHAQIASSLLLLWLEFEHNLARGWFLEALTAAAASPQMDVDYLDLSDVAGVQSLLNKAHTTRKMPVKDFAPQSPMLVSLPESKTLFLRDAWRHVIYEKIKLTLQISHDNHAYIDSDDDPTVASLLTTAMELSTRLDEPDLDAFTWLTSGFLNMQSASSTKEGRALAQIQHSLNLTRENSLAYLCCLALQCAADYALRRRDDAKQPKEMLTEATKLLTVSDKCAAMEPPLKMQLHAMLRELTTNKSASARPGMHRAHSTLAGPEHSREHQAPVPRGGSSNSLLDKVHRTMSFSLWSHVFGSGFTSASSRRGSYDASGDTIKRLLLHRVSKPIDGTSGSCYVDVLGAHGTHKARFRVFYSSQKSFSWLQDHIDQRYDVVRRCSEADSVENMSSPAGFPPDPVRVELFYDPQRKELVPDLETTRLSQWITSPAPTYVLHAKLTMVVVSSHRSSVVIRPASPRCTSTPTPAIVLAAQHKPLQKEPTVPAAPSVLCSLCGRRLALDDVETHSETCF